MERWLPPRAFVLGVALSAPVFLASSFSLFTLVLTYFFGSVRCSVFVLWSALCGFSFFVLSCSCLLLVLMSWGGGGGVPCVGGYVWCGVCVFSSASPCFKESPRGAPLCTACLLLLLSVPSSCFLSICCFFRACSCLVHVHEWRWRPLGLRSMSSCDAALLTQTPLPAYCLLPALLPYLLIMADAAPAVPRQQKRRREARAQVDEDVRRVCQRMDDTDVRLDTLEGRLRGHNLRLQYLEAPLKLVLKKFKAPVEFWAAKDNGFQLRRPNPPFRPHFFKSFVSLEELLSSIFWRRLSLSWRSWTRM